METVSVLRAELLKREREKERGHACYVLQSDVCCVTEQNRVALKKKKKNKKTKIKKIMSPIVVMTLARA